MKYSYWLLGLLTLSAACAKGIGDDDGAGLGGDDDASGGDADADADGDGDRGADADRDPGAGADGDADADADGDADADADGDGDADGGGSVCEPTASCDLCVTCANEGPCADLAQACLANPDCVQASQCGQGCGGDEDCQDACLVEFAGGAADHAAYSQCVLCEQCPVVCGANDC